MNKPATNKQYQQEVKEIDMGILFWKKNKLIDQFAITIADELYSEVLPEVIEEYFSKINNKEASKNDKTVKKVDRKLREMVAEIRQFKNVQKLGVYGKARLHMTFAERLAELGYKKTLAKKLSEDVIVKTA